MLKSSIGEIARAPTMAYSEKDWEAARAALTPDFVYDEVPTGRRVEGVEQVLEVWGGWAEAFPDSRSTIHAEHVSGDAVVLELTWNGTHTGPLRTPDGEIPPTGRKVEFRACQILEVVDDRTSTMRHYFDMATMLRQLGVGS
jgi:steroid delta-isomerase-like uncharacterized protein